MRIIHLFILYIPSIQQWFIQPLDIDIKIYKDTRAKPNYLQKNMSTCHFVYQLPWDQTWITTVTSQLIIASNFPCEMYSSNTRWFRYDRDKL
jgi:hypothetical protein